MDMRQQLAQAAKDLQEARQPSSRFPKKQRIDFPLSAPFEPQTSFDNSHAFIRRGLLRARVRVYALWYYMLMRYRFLDLNTHCVRALLPARAGYTQRHSSTPHTLHSSTIPMDKSPADFRAPGRLFAPRHGSPQARKSILELEDQHARTERRIAETDRQLQEAAPRQK